MRVEISRIDPSLPLPGYATAGATGFDFLCREERRISPGEICLVPGNVIIRVPKGYVLLVALRSGTPRRKNLLMPNGVGVIDQDYCGPSDEIAIQVMNVGEETVVVERGERIAQGLLLPVSTCDWVEVESKDGTSRGGFGSTGR